MPGTPERTKRMARVLWTILENDGPGPKTGLSGQMAHALGHKVSPRDFADALQYARRVLSAERGVNVIYSHATNQYGFPEDIAQSERYILSFNAKYLASRAETMVIQANAAQLYHGKSASLALFSTITSGFAEAIRKVIDLFNPATTTRAERSAKRTGGDAPVQLEERIR